MSSSASSATQAPDYKALYEGAIQQVDALQLQLLQLRKLIFGSKHERFVPTDDKRDTQLKLDLDADTIAQCKLTDKQDIHYIRTKTEVTAVEPKNHPGRMKLPEHLRREAIVLLPDADVSGLRKIGDDITEILDCTPGELFVKQYIRPRYVQPLSDTNDTIITASLPGRLLEKCMAGEGLLAQIISDKYVDHLPLHRQLQRFERSGVRIAQSTINDWTRAVLTQLAALYEAHKKEVLQSGYLHADETPIKVLDSEKKNASHQGYYWVYHNSMARIALFDYRKGRGREGPDDILQDFQGYLQTDGYAAYDAFDKRPGITLMHCMAHARRKFYDALQSDRSRAEHALALFAQLYDAERTISEQSLDGEAILKLRNEQATPALQALKQWMTEQYPQVTPRSPIGQAIAYCLPRWEKLSTYTTQWWLKIDNNPVENAIRPVAIGRKNYLFAGSHDAAQRAAMVYSLFATCRMQGINPYTWLKDVLQRMHLYKANEIFFLLPQHWEPVE